MTLAEPSGLNPNGENTLPSAAKNTTTNYTQEFTAAGGEGGPYTFELKNSTLPQGWELGLVVGIQSDTVTLSGMPGTVGIYQFTVRVKDKAGNAADYVFTLKVVENASVAVTGITGIPKYMREWAQLILDGKVLPDNAAHKDIIWEALDESHDTYYTLSGNVLKSIGGTNTVNLQARIINGKITEDYTQTFQIEILYPIALQPAEGDLTQAQVNTEYHKTFEAMHGQPDGTDYQFGIVAGKLPNGLTLEKLSGDNDKHKAKLAGIPTETGNFSFTIRVTDGDGNSEEFSYTLEVTDSGNGINILSLPVQTGRPGNDDIILDEEAETASSSDPAPEEKPEEKSEKKGGDTEGGTEEALPADPTKKEEKEGDGADEGEQEASPSDAAPADAD